MEPGAYPASTDSIPDSPIVLLLPEALLVEAKAGTLGAGEEADTQDQEGWRVKGNMQEVELVLIPELGQPRSLPYPDAQEAKYSARGFSRKGPQRIIAWYILAEDGLILDHHGWAETTLRSIRPDAHSERDLQREVESTLSREERVEDLIQRVSAERRAAAWS